MALRIRKDGRVLCAALHPAETGDAYLDDGVHYELSVERRVLVTEAMPAHATHGQWWWKGQEPDTRAIDPFYYETPGLEPPGAQGGTASRVPLLCEGGPGWYPGRQSLEGSKES